MRIAITAILALLLVGTIFAQNAPDTAQDGTQAAVEPAQDAAVAPDATIAPDATSTSDANLAADAEPAPSTNGESEATASSDSSTGQEPAAAAKPKFGFKGGLNLGSDVLQSGAGGASETWTLLGFQPDISFGKIGIGLDLSFHLMLYQTQDTPLKLYKGDWVPQGNQTIFDVYLPKFLYIRYGLKGEDPLFAKLGSINDLSLGNGFIMSSYSNMLFLPKDRIFGLDLGVDGKLFGFPYVGIELLTGNLARFDVIGGRVFARPLIDTAIPILKDMEVGTTLVADTDAYLHDATKTNATAKSVAAYGADITVPILKEKAFSMAAFTDIAVDPNQTMGWMLGTGGRIISIFTYGAQLRILADGFIPSYFDSNYDIYRSAKYDFMQNAANKGGPVYAGWFAAIGTSLIGDKLVFNSALDGPLKAKGVAANLANAKLNDYPHFRTILRLGQLPKIPFYFDASYEKYLLGAKAGFFQDLFDKTNAVIGININYQTGASVLTLAYNAKWDPTAAKFDVTSSLQASMKF